MLIMVMVLVFWFVRNLLCRSVNDWVVVRFIFGITFSEIAMACLSCIQERIGLL
jgi:hypothetical protein